MPQALAAPCRIQQHEDHFRCVACGQDDPAVRPVLSAVPPAMPFDLYRCSACGLVQQHPRWSPAKIASLYDKDYYVFTESEAQRWARAIQQYQIHLARFEAAANSHARSSAPRGMRLLDVGCAMGHLAVLARNRGWRVTGLDLSADAVSHAAVRFGLDVRAGSLASHVGTLLPFDVVLLGDVIEHVADPIRFLTDVRKVLAPGGVLCIDTPNWGGFWRRWGKSAWLGLNRFHINLFDAGSLQSVLAACGFQNIQATSYTHYRYEGLASRPEVRAWIQKLPNFLAWRITRFLDNRHPNTAWSTLRNAPPQSLEQALACLTGTLAIAPRTHDDSLRADNLIATAQR